MGLGETPLRRERRGDISVVLDVNVPTSLTEEERDLHEQLAALRGEESTRRKGHGPFAKLRDRDRKSTRLHSSHVAISYAVFCWKKKIKNKHMMMSIQLNIQ